MFILDHITRLKKKISSNGIQGFDYSLLSNREFEKLQNFTLKARDQGVLKKEIEKAEQILRSVYIGNQE